MATSIPFNTDKWTSLDSDHPLEGDIHDDGSCLNHVTVGGTDWWRTTQRHSMEGPALGFWVDVTNEGFEVSVDITVDPQVQYDQATLFLYVSPTQWVKAGIELDNGALWNGAVVCNPYSDWSIAKRRSDDSSRFTISYTPNEVKVYLADDMIREVKWFGPTKDAEATPGGQSKVFVGVMACSPKEGGAKISWRDFALKKGVRAH